MGQEYRLATQTIGDAFGPRPPGKISESLRFASVVVVIVGYRNAADVADCLRALAASRPQPSFEIFIAENGGAVGMDALMARLDAGESAWREEDAAARRSGR